MMISESDATMKLSRVVMAATLAFAVAQAVAVAAPQASAQPAAAQNVQNSVPLDEQIARRIANDPVLKADAIRVAVDGSVATLSGIVADEADRVSAEQLAMVPGITRVENKLVTRDGAKSKVKGTAGKAAEKTKSGAVKVGEKSKDVGVKVAEKTKAGVSKTDEVLTDGWVSSRIRTKFMGDESLRNSDIQVNADKHVVTLSGTVVSDAARTKALAIAKQVEGVDSVVDQLTVAPPKS
jgi:hyperosmotically inducible protein